MFGFDDEVEPVAALVILPVQMSRDPDLNSRVPAVVVLLFLVFFATKQHYGRHSIPASRDHIAQNVIAGDRCSVARKQSFSFWTQDEPNFFIWTK